MADAADSEAEIAGVIKRYVARLITKMEACSELGILQSRFEQILEMRGVSRQTGNVPSEKRKWDVSDRDRDLGEARWSAAMDGRRYDAFHVTPDPRRAPKPMTIVPRVSPMGDV